MLNRASFIASRVVRSAIVPTRTRLTHIDSVATTSGTSHPIKLGNTGKEDPGKDLSVHSDHVKNVLLSQDINTAVTTSEYDKIVLQDGTVVSVEPAIAAYKSFCRGINEGLLEHEKVQHFTFAEFIDFCWNRNFGDKESHTVFTSENDDLILLENCAPLKDVLKRRQDLLLSKNNTIVQKRLKHDEVNDKDIEPKEWSITFEVEDADMTDSEKESEYVEVDSETDYLRSVISGMKPGSPEAAYALLCAVMKKHYDGDDLILLTYDEFVKLKNKSHTQGYCHSRQGNSFKCSSKSDYLLRMSRSGTITQKRCYEDYYSPRERKLLGWVSDMDGKIEDDKILEEEDKASLKIALAAYKNFCLGLFEGLDDMEIEPPTFYEFLNFCDKLIYKKLAKKQ